MTVPQKHKNSEQHRGIVPEDQLASGTPSVGDVVTATLTGEAEWAAAGGGGGGAVGLMPIAGPIGFSGALTFGSTTTLAFIASGLAGACAVPIHLTAPMLLEGYGVFNRDTTLARSAEARLYLDSGSATVNEIAGSDAAFSFTPTAASDRRASVSGAPISLSPGVYWLVIRNTHATNNFALGRASVPSSAVFTGNRIQSIAALGSTLDLDTGWTNSFSVPALWAEGRVLGRTTALT